ncbi:hypothetical protein [Ktedonobacter sp. SOSP1-52]|uniref:hypothetical protein n=1 Tax=Ktedonobacter sp. SOSP1-52 TaxID=2778366 RepID=UPI0019153447|nr:hypothetical protein [Ktedonobacter sp. SOSP1-52]
MLLKAPFCDEMVGDFDQRLPPLLAWRFGCGAFVENPLGNGLNVLQRPLRLIHLTLLINHLIKYNTKKHLAQSVDGHFKNGKSTFESSTTV